jgi:hypothetical protein
MNMEKKNVLILSKPLKVSTADQDIEIKELEYDFENMTAKDKINVGKRIKADGIPVSVEEIDTDYHFYLFAAAVSKANPAIDISDVLRISAKDAREGARLARDFFYRNLEE